ncbi:putative membrane protein [Amnibacterium kyonggiense]|uniref:Putative membrane protein n=2 Tax=Amnibacterium kyonggiense TaxID=595671 RepID=A0A4R7FL85_9MICO|nr:putative membrane protein [Amnibacterium kyonggiense]
MEAFSDGVIAILITIMVLELPKPDGGSWAAIRADLPVLLAYVLSFVYLGIYWNNHHHMLQAVRRVSGPVLWANLHLLFWLSLVPFVTDWITEVLGEKRPEGEAPDLTAPLVAYGAVLLAAGVAYFILQTALIRAEGRDSALAAAVGRDVKGKISAPLYLAGILLSLVQPLLGAAVYVLVAVLWFVPDRRVERQIAHQAAHGEPEQD